MAEKDSPSSSTHSHSPSHSQNLSNSISDSSSNFSNNVSVHHLPLDPHALALDLVMGTAAAVAKSFSAPIERIKLLIQNQSELLKVGRLDHPYKGIIDCFTRVVEQDGIISLWRGNWASVVRYFTSQALNFGLRDEFKHLFNAHQQQGYWRWFAINLASGGLAGACTLVFVQSLDFARTRLANDQRSLVKGGVRQFSGLTDVYRQTIRSDGFAALYRGFGVSCAGLFVYRGLFFGLYDTLKPAVVCGPWHDSLVAAFMLGWAVTLVAGFVAYPLDTIRRRRMMNGEYRSSWHCLHEIVSKEGPRAMFRGWGANVLRSVAGATSLAGYDHLEKIIFGKSISPVHAAKADHAH